MGKRGCFFLIVGILGFFLGELQAEEIVLSKLDAEHSAAREAAFIPWCQQEESTGYWKLLSPAHIPIYNEKTQGGWMRDIYVPKDGAGYWVLNGLSKRALFLEDKDRRRHDFELVGSSSYRDEQGQDNYWALWVPRNRLDVVREKMLALGITPARIDLTFWDRLMIWGGSLDSIAGLLAVTALCISLLNTAWLIATRGLSRRKVANE